MMIMIFLNCENLYKKQRSRDRGNLNGCAYDYIRKCYSVIL